MDYSKNSNKNRKKSAVSKTKKARNRLVTIGFRIIISSMVIFMFAIGGVVFGAYMGVVETVAHMGQIQYTPPYHSSIILDMHGTEIGRFLAEENREYIPLSQIPQHLQDAFIAIEDQRFFEHNGVDMRGTARAMYMTLFTDRTEGGSTITQQLIKNNVMRIHYNTIETKLQEQFLALRLENELTDSLGSREAAKNYILEMYLNTINLGGQLHGVQTAAQFYFGKDAADLTISESAVIAAITQNPARYHPVRNPEQNRLRQTTVLNRMLAQGFITENQHYHAINDDVFDRIGEFRVMAAEEGTVRSYFEDHLFNTLVEDLIATGQAATRGHASQIIHNHGLVIETTMDPRIQAIMEAAHMDDSFFPGEFEISIEYSLTMRNTVTGDIYNHTDIMGTVFTADAIDYWVENTRNELLGEHGVVMSERILPAVQPQSAMVVMDHHTGMVRGIVGGRGEKVTNLSLNRATQSERHPGSVFKMVAAYAPAFDLGLIAPSSILIDEPLVVGNWAPQNWNHRFEGRVNVRRAVAQSMNVVAVRTMQDVGVDVAFDYLLNFGFTTLQDEVDQFGRTDRGLSTALGGLTTGVNQLELTAAFAAIANNGQYISPIMYTRVTNHEGRVILYADPTVRQVIRPEAAYMLTSTMIDVVTSGTGTRARLNNGMAVAGKTGTSQNTHDLNFVGFTNYYTAGIWRGHDQPRTLRAHQHSHVTLWAHVMNEIHNHENYPVIASFARPAGIRTAAIVAGTGQLAIEGVHPDGSVRAEIFDGMNIPTETSTIAQRVIIDTLTGLPITGDTPYYRQRIVYGNLDPSTGQLVIDEEWTETATEDEEMDLEGYGIYDPGDPSIGGDSLPPVYDIPEEFEPTPTIPDTPSSEIPYTVQSPIFDNPVDTGGTTAEPVIPAVPAVPQTVPAVPQTVPAEPVIPFVPFVPEPLPPVEQFVEPQFNDGD